MHLDSKIIHNKMRPDICEKYMEAFKESNETHRLCDPDIGCD